MMTTRMMVVPLSSPEDPAEDPAAGGDGLLVTDVG